MSSIVSVHALDEAGAALRILVLRRRALRPAEFAIVIIIPEPAVPADAVLMVQADVEPDRRIESAMLVHAKPGQLVVKCFRFVRIREISVGDTPIGDGPGDAMHELAHRRFAAALVRIGPVGDVAVKVF